MKERLKKAQEIISDGDALIIENPIDLTYLTGIPISAGKLLIKKNEIFLIVDGRYFERAKLEKDVTAILDSTESFKACLQDVKKVIFDGENLSWDRAQDLMKAYTSIKFISQANPLKHIRSIKESEELEKMRKAASLGSEGFDFVLSQLQEGLSEKEIASRLHLFWIQKGGKNLAFDPIIAFGPNAALPHHRPCNDKLKRGQTVLIDIGVILDDYHSDMTRTVFFGEPPEKMKEIYAIVKDAHEEALKLAIPGAKMGELDARAREVIASKGYSEFYTHGLGHGVGLEIHEWPYLKNRPPYANDILEAGMCLTIEPGIYLPNLGGVRIEDTYVIRNGEAESLTRRSRDLKVI